MWAITRRPGFRAEKGNEAMDSGMPMDSLADWYADQPVLHGGRHATFLHMSRGAAIIRYWGDSHAVAVPPETLSLRTMKSAAKPTRPLAAGDEPIARDTAR
jgi:hypothetical protein